MTTFTPTGFWHTTRPYSPGPALVGDLDVDVAIVGGGYTGLSTAHFLHRAEPTMRIAILEADFIGHRRERAQRRVQHDQDRDDALPDRDEGVGRRPGEAADDAALAERAHLAGVGLDDGGAEADLAVAGDDHTTIFTNGQYSRGVPGARLVRVRAGGLHCISIQAAGCWAREPRGAALERQGSS